ncbi:hypothetical protein GCM10023314_02380 [Algibacter agarivorans]|uniref:Uncharacterized protein n=1 Tax=Algibacter agarivorans TaxID=1109741 RepID=A0ABP9GCP2_9FLAO
MSSILKTMKSNRSKLIITLLFIIVIILLVLNIVMVYNFSKDAKIDNENTAEIVIGKR